MDGQGGANAAACLRGEAVVGVAISACRVGRGHIRPDHLMNGGLMPPRVVAKWHGLRQGTKTEHHHYAENQHGADSSDLINHTDHAEIIPHGPVDFLIYVKYRPAQRARDVQRSEAKARLAPGLRSYICTGVPSSGTTTLTPEPSKPAMNLSGVWSSRPNVL